MWQVQPHFYFLKCYMSTYCLMLLNFSYVCIFFSHLVCKISMGNMCFPKKTRRCFAHKCSTSIWISANLYNSDNHTKRQKFPKGEKITCWRSSNSGLQEVILILPILIVACLLMTSCESGVSLVTSCNQTFYFYF